MTTMRCRATLAAFLLGLLALPAPAPASEANAPCAGFAAEDAAGDSSPLVKPDPTGADLRRNLDLTGLYFRRDGGRTSAFIRVRELGEGAPAGTTGVAWLAAWTDAAGTHRFVAADVDGMPNPSGAPTVSYRYGTMDADGFGITTEGTTTGVLLPGANGLVRIDVPAALAPAGAVLAAPFAIAREVRVVRAGRAFGAVIDADRAPDSGGGAAFTVADCG